jgi:hypothetical protein
MKRWLSLGSAALLAAAVILPARSADAGAQVTKFQIRDHSLNAVFAAGDGCFFATTTIRFASSIEQTGGPPAPQPALTQVEVAYENGCTNEFFDLTGGTTQQVVRIASNLSAASLSTVVTVTDGVVSADVTIDAVFTANGDLQEVKDHTVTHDAGSVTVERLDFEARPADMTGSSVTTVLPLAAGPTSLDLSQDQVSGQMGQDVFGTRTITAQP